MSNSKMQLHIKSFFDKNKDRIKSVFTAINTIATLLLSIGALALAISANNMAARSNELAINDSVLQANDKTQDSILGTMKNLLVKNDAQISELRHITLSLTRQLSMSLKDSAYKFYVDSVTAWEMLDNICDTIDTWAFFRSDTTYAGFSTFRSELKSKLTTVLSMASINKTNTYIRNTPEFVIIYRSIAGYFRDISNSLTFTDPLDRNSLYVIFEKFRDGQLIIKNLFMSCIVDGGKRFDAECIKEVLKVKR